MFYDLAYDCTEYRDVDMIVKADGFFNENKPPRNTYNNTVLEIEKME
jgi:hypothetical protein